MPGSRRHSIGLVTVAFVAASSSTPLAAFNGALYLPLGIGITLAIAATAFALLTRRRARRQVQEAEAERDVAVHISGTVLETSGDLYWEFDLRQGKVRRLGNDRLLEGVQTQEVEIDRFLASGVHPEDRERLNAEVQAVLNDTKSTFDLEYRLRQVDGEYMWVHARGRVHRRDSEGRPLGIAGTTRDVGMLHEAERETRIAFQVLRSMSEAVAVFSLDYRFIAINPAFSRITGYTDHDAREMTSSSLDSSQHSAEFYQRARTVLERSGRWSGEMWQRCKDGSEFLSWIELSEVRDGNGVRTHYVAVLNDITQKKRAEQELRYLANYDTLTGLPNRTLLAERLSRAIIRARRQESRVCVLYIDLDRFKDINDSLGHAAGDRLLKSVASRLQATVGPTDTVARLGGDEFTVIVEDVESTDAIERCARDILAAFATPLEVDERHHIQISPSIGISLYPDNALVPTDLLKFADTAMYHAKAQGRNNHQFYTDALDAESRRRATLLAALRRALTQDELRLVFQPRMALKDDRIIAVEALLRWRSAELGDISPVTFIPLAEESGLILPIGEWVLGEACRTLKRWHDAGLDGIACSVNVSVAQLLRSPLVAQLGAFLDQTDLSAKHIELEVTESMVMQNAEQTTAVLEDLRSLGVRLAIDDFGTGYSSLVYLKRLPIDTLKIDKEFIGDLTDDPDDASITATVITMAHSLGLNVVAEGVESAEQLAFLRAQGCEEIQGYYLSRPLEADACLAFIQRHRGSGQAAA